MKNTVLGVLAVLVLALLVGCGGRYRQEAVATTGVPTTATGSAETGGPTATITTGTSSVSTATNSTADAGTTITSGNGGLTIGATDGP